jgi:hypothetical protein
MTRFPPPGYSLALSPGTKKAGHVITDLMLHMRRVLRRDLKGEELDIANRWSEKVAGKPLRTGVWKSDHEDAFIRGFGRFCWERRKLLAAQSKIGQV